MRRLALQFVCAAIVTGVIMCRAAAAFAAERGDSILTPPGATGQPIDVYISLHLVNLASIDEVAQRFTIDGYLFLKWKDPRLAFVPSGPDDRERDYTPGQIWLPKLSILNAAMPRERYEVSIRAGPDGTVNYAERMKAEVSSRFELRRFPFDRQTLLVIIHPFLLGKPPMIFHLGKHATWTASEFNSYTSLAQWRLGKTRALIGSASTYGGLKLPEARFDISVSRRSSFYLWKVFLPLTLMVILSWAAFWISPDDLQSQLQVGVTTILTVIAFAFAISLTMPHVPYLTYIDAFFLQCYIFVFAAIAEVMAVHVAHRSDRSRDFGIRIRKFSRWVIPAAFAVSNLWLAIEYLA
ncbi:MAG: hypothetical protein ACREQI_01345 [Candidatus Binataceae bacterium]